MKLIIHLLFLDRRLYSEKNHTQILTEIVSFEGQIYKNYLLLLALLTPTPPIDILIKLKVCFLIGMLCRL